MMSCFYAKRCCSKLTTCNVEQAARSNYRSLKSSQNHSLLLGSVRAWRFGLRSVIATGQKPMSTLNDTQGKQISTGAQDPAPTGEGRLDDLYRYLWIKCVGHEPAVLDSYEKFLTSAAQHLGIDYVKTEEPHRHIRRRTLLASRHVHKKYRVQYEIRNYYRNVLFKNITGSTADTFLEYVERNIPEGVLFVAEKHRLEELPFDLEKSELST